LARTLKDLAKAAVGAAAASPPLRPVIGRKLSGRVNVVYYHAIGPPLPYTADFDLGATLERFERDLRVLERRFELVSLWDAVDGATSSSRSRPALAVTFDDGFDLVESGVADVLDRHGVRATSFLITGCLDNRDLMWRNKLSAIRALVPEARYVAAYNELAASDGLAPIASGAELLAESMRWPIARKDDLADALWERSGMAPLAGMLAESRPYFRADTLADWLRRGHEVGLHTKTHPICSLLDEEGVRTEIVEPAQELRRRFGIRRLAFSYPFGVRADESVERALSAEGAVDALFGIAGFARRGVPPHRLERSCADGGVAYGVFGTALRG
jgi:peptidoglycan/xylan/chitin deacetylase (PgdA/CDA1 family)